MTASTATPADHNAAALRYDTWLRRARFLDRLPPGTPMPAATAAWPAENVALLEHYRVWLVSGGASPHEVHTLYVPMAGHALGLNLRLHADLDLDTDLARALDYVRAKAPSAEWANMCRVALEKFRRFLRQQRGALEDTPRPVDLTGYQEGLPAWLVAQLERYQRLKQRNWRPARTDQQIRRFWGAHARLWRWLCARRAITGPGDLRRQDLLDYLDHCLAAGHSASYINSDMHLFHGFLGYLQEQDLAVPQALFRLPSLKQPDSLPRYLTDEQMRALRDDFETRVTQATDPGPCRDALLDRAAFYLLWQGGMRLGEVEELRLADLDLGARRLTVRLGKNQKTAPCCSPTRPCARCKRTSTPAARARQITCSCTAIARCARTCCAAGSRPPARAWALACIPIACVTRMRRSS